MADLDVWSWMVRLMNRLDGSPDKRLNWCEMKSEFYIVSKLTNFCITTVSCLQDLRSHI